MWNEIHKATGNNKYVSSIHPDLNCTEMNNFFTGIGKEISDNFDKVPLDWKHPKCPYIFTFDHVHENLICKALLQLSNDSSLDVLDFDTKLLRLAAPHIFKSLTYIINVSLKTGVFPADWKFARITPIYKGKGCKKTKGNYRPISVVCHVAKLVERQVQAQLLDYLTDHDMISVDQFAFLKNHSTQSSLHRVIDEFYESFNEHELLGSCLLDISKCFDTIDHELLLFKLEQYGVSGNESKWFKT